MVVVGGVMRGRWCDGEWWEWEVDGGDGEWVRLRI